MECQQLKYCTRILGLFYVDYAFQVDIHVKLVTCIIIDDYYFEKEFSVAFSFRFVILTAIDTTYPVDLRQRVDHGSTDQHVFLEGGAGVCGLLDTVGDLDLLSTKQNQHQNFRLYHLHVFHTPGFQQPY